MQMKSDNKDEQNKKLDPDTEKRVEGYIRAIMAFNPKSLKIRRQGEWKISSEGWYPYCSECGKEPKGGMSNYCPNCGAKMGFRRL